MSITSLTPIGSMLMKLEHEEALRYIEQIQGEKKLSAYLNQKAGFCAFTKINGATFHSDRHLF
jgi:hypothetical protein